MDGWPAFQHTWWPSWLWIWFFVVGKGIDKRNCQLVGSWTAAVIVQKSKEIPNNAVSIKAFFQTDICQCRTLYIVEFQTWKRRGGGRWWIGNSIFPLDRSSPHNLDALIDHQTARLCSSWTHTSKSTLLYPDQFYTESIQCWPPIRNGL